MPSLDFTAVIWTAISCHSARLLGTSAHALPPGRPVVVRLRPHPAGYPTYSKDVPDGDARRLQRADGRRDADARARGQRIAPAVSRGRPGAARDQPLPADPRRGTPPGD